MIASHYAEPLERVVTKAATLLVAAADDAEPLFDLKPGDPFAMLDNSLGWAWGYAGKDRRVGYVRSKNVGAP